MNMKKQFSQTIHHGRNIKRLREILGIKQYALAVKLNITQQAISDLEKKVQINDEVLEKVAEVLKVSVEDIKNLDEETIINQITNTSHNELYNDTSVINIQSMIDQSNKHTKILEELLKTEQEKITLLKKAVVGNR
jgi:transcriptional regulator with XRE-family HTH domain